MKTVSKRAKLKTQKMKSKFLSLTKTGMDPVTIATLVINAVTGLLSIYATYLQGKLDGLRK
jgi:hypothetical protein